ncbi:MAG: DUF1559 domain-containing protein [Planctomycetaceae bacterium]
MPRPRRINRHLAALSGRGFTLIELLVVISIIAILVALLLPAVQQVREAARSTQCKDRLHNLGVALHNYEGSFRVYPPGYIYKPGPTGNACGASWGLMILPQLEQKPLYDQFDFNRPIFDAANLAPREQHLDIFLCDSDPVSEEGFIEMQPGEQYAMSSYAACFGPPDLDDNQEQRLGMFSRNSSTGVRNITDGTSNTLAIGERVNGPFRKSGVHGPHFSYETTWMAAVREITDPTDDHGHMVLFQTGNVPNSESSDDRDVSASHTGFAHFAMGDGAVRIVSENVDFNLYQALSTVAGGEVVKIP